MDMRQRMVEATGRVMRSRGLAGTTTREIAREARCAEGSIYRHFENRQELLAAAAEGCLPNTQFVRSFAARAGEGTVRGNLEDFARVALSTFAGSVPLWAAVLSDSGVLAAHRRNNGGRSGLEDAFEAVASYVTAEKELGRVNTGVDAQAVAELLIGACHSRAFLRGFMSEPEEHDERFFGGLVEALLAGLAPNGAGR